MTDSVRERLTAALEDRYRIEGELGRGGMAMVYLAEDLKHERRVAIKVLSPELSAVVGPERFLREIGIVAKLSHPHVLPLHDSGEADGLLFYVMPYVEESSLKDRLEQDGPLPLADALRIAKEVASALQYAHDQGVLHRDVKADNVLLQAGHAVVADFGIARAVDVAGGPQFTGTGMMIGTPGYMSPEQATGEAELDARSDIYSLGCMLYEMLTGERPYTGKTFQAIMARQIMDPVPRVSDHRALPAGVETALTRALAKSPDDRFATAAELAAALDEGAATGIVSRRPWLPRPAPGLTVAAVAAVATVTGVAGWLALSGDPSAGEPESPAPEATELNSGARPSIAVLPFLNQSDDPENEYFSEGVAEEILTGLSGSGNLRVASRTSSFSFKGQDVDLATIADRLDVDHVLEGSVRRFGNRVLITASLIDVGTDSQLWSNRFERELDDVFEIQREISSSIARELEVTLGTEGAAAVAVGPPTSNMEAYQLYLRARYIYHNAAQPGGLERLRLSVELFERALQLDPGFARAWSGLAATYALLVPVRNIVNVEDPAGRAAAAVAEALALDPSLAEAHAVMGLRHAEDGRWAEAERSFLRAIEADPQYGNTLRWYGILLVHAGRSREANEILLRATELDPLSAGTADWLADSFRGIGDFDEARLHSQRSVDLGFVVGGIGVYIYHLQRQEWEVAIAYQERIAALEGIDPAYVRPIVEAIQDRSRIPAAVAAASRVEAEHPNFEPLYFYYDIRDPDLVFDAVEPLFEEGRGQLALFRLWEPGFTDLRNSARFRELAESVGLVEYWREMGWPDRCRPDADGFVCD